MKTTGERPCVSVTAGGSGVVSHAGARLLVDLAEATGLTAGFGWALAGLRSRDAGHDPGRVLADLAVMMADGGEAISDLAVLRDQPELFGPVASTATAWRVLAAVDEDMLGVVRHARAAAREVSWAQRAEVTGRAFPPARAADRVLDGLVLDIDATLVDCHSEKEGAAPTYKYGFGYYPLICFLDKSSEALAGLLRAGNAGSNTAADHIGVVDAALAQIPDAHRHGTPFLVRADAGGVTTGFLAHLRGLREVGMDVRFCVGWPIDEPVRQAIGKLSASAWCDALDANGEMRDRAQVAEVTGLLDLTGWPEDTRVIVRRERPHPGAQLSLFDHIEGFRHQCVATDVRRRRVDPVSGGPPPRPRPGGRPHPLRQRHRHRPPPIPRVRHQHRLVGGRVGRHRPAGLDTDHARP